MKQRVLKARTGTVVFDCREGQPSAATVSIYHATGADLPTTPVHDAAATIDTVSTTIASWSSTTPLQCTVASVTGIVAGRDYLITSVSTGRSTWLRVQSIVTSTKTLCLEDRPEFDLAASDTLKGTRISYALSAAQTASIAVDIWAEWTYTVASVVYVGTCLFDIARSLPYNPARVGGLRRYRENIASNWGDLATGNQTWQQRLDAAFEQVLSDMEAKGLEKDAVYGIVNAVVDWSQAELSVYEACLYGMAEDGMPGPGFGSERHPEWLQARRDRYSQTLDAFVRTMRWWDAQADRVMDETERVRNLSSPRGVL